METKLNDEQLVEYVSRFIKDISKVGLKVIAIIGGPASGKGTLARKLSESLGKTAVLSTDNYNIGDRKWRRTNIEDLGKDPLLKYNREYLNYQVKKIIQLQDGEEIGIPIYDSQTGIAISADPEERPDETNYSTKVRGKQDFIIVEGDFQFLDTTLMDSLIYLDVADDIRLQNRLYRDTKERPEHADPQESIRRTTESFELRQKTQFFPYTLPQRELADLVITVEAIPLEQPTPQTQFAYSYTVMQQER